MRKFTKTKTTKSIDGVKSGYVSDAKRMHFRAKHASAHKPISSQTLMRSAVKKPGRSLKRQLRAYGPTDYSATRPALSLATPMTNRLKTKATLAPIRVKKSQLISHFSAVTSDMSSLTLATPPKPKPAPASLAPKTLKTDLQYPHKKPRTTSEILEIALQKATSHEQAPLPRPTKKRRRVSHLWGSAA